MALLLEIPIQYPSRYAKRMLLCSAIAGLSLSAWAGSGLEEEDLAKVYGDKGFVSIATGSVQPVHLAPAVATVITAEDIEALGARSLEDVLVLVPGLHVSRSFSFNSPIYTFRGIHSQFNPQVLVLVDDLPVTNVFGGDRGAIWGTVPVELISRIEVIRGPGSALYGADALTGVINIVTKSPEELKGSRLSAAYGSFDTAELTAIRGVEGGALQYSTYLHVGRTDGASRTIRADQQTVLDAVFGTSASLAPGPINLGQRVVDAGFDLRWQEFTLRAGYKKRSDVDTGVGLASAIDRQGEGWGERYALDLGWRNATLFSNWDLSARLNYEDQYEKANLVLFPPGAFGNAFPDGMIGEPYKWERHAGISGSATYSGFAAHRLRFGAGYRKEDLYRVEESKNYTFVVVPGLGTLPVPLGSLVDVSDISPFIEPHGRIVRYAYAQDEWSLARDWVVTAGVRHDRYSDFGGTTNPRVALVWEAAYDVTAKLMYGRAFRPPSFVELYNLNNPVVNGNPNLKPETIETREAAVTWQAAAGLQVGANAYLFTMRDILRFVPNADPSSGNTAQNVGELKGQGLELEFAWDATRQFRLSGNYAHQRTWDPDTGDDPGNAPRNRAYLRTDWRFSPGWSLNTQVNWVADRRRESNDPRGPIEDYTLVDLALRTEAPGHQWSVTLAVRNLFDVDAREPSPAPGLIPDDFPLPGRQISIQGNFAF
jgi:outer membrane receptor for ferrienterochelin and colicins